MNWSLSPINFGVPFFACSRALIVTTLVLLPNWTMAEVSGEACAKDLAAKVKTVHARSDILQLALTDPTLRERILARKRSVGDIHFSIEEFRPLFEEMKAQVSSLRARANSARTLNPFGMIKKWGVVPLEANRLEREIDQHLNSNLPYDRSLELIVDFVYLADEVTALEPNHSRFLISPSRGSKSKLKNDLLTLGGNTPLLIIPTFTTLDYSTFNRIWSGGIVPLGLVTRIAEADRLSFRPSTFLAHDYLHAIMLLSNLLRSLANRDSDQLQDLYSQVSLNGLGLTRELYDELNLHLREQANMLRIFFHQVDQISEPRFKESVEFSFFHSDHERGSFFGDYPIHGELRRPGTSIAVNSMNADPSTSLVWWHLISEQDRVKWFLAVQDWILEHWMATAHSLNEVAP